MLVHRQAFIFDLSGYAENIFSRADLFCMGMSNDATDIYWSARTCWSQACRGVA